MLRVKKEPMEISNSDEELLDSSIVKDLSIKKEAHMFGNYDMRIEYDSNLKIKKEPRNPGDESIAYGELHDEPLELVNKHTPSNIKVEYIVNEENEQFKSGTVIKQEFSINEDDNITCSEINTSDNLPENLKVTENDELTPILTPSLLKSTSLYNNVGANPERDCVSIANLTGKKLYDFPKKDLKKRKYSKETKNDSMKMVIRLKERPSYSCDLCSHVSKKRSDLKSHKLSHSEETPHVCEECGVAFRKLSSLISHNKTHTGVKAFRCDQCDYSSNFTNSIKTHKIMHSGEKPLACSECSYTCGRTSNLNRHMLRHSQVRTFPCDMCTYVSKDITILKVHKLVHTGKKPHVCDVCNRSYVTVKSLNHHKKKHYKSNIGLV